MKSGGIVTTEVIIANNLSKKQNVTACSFFKWKKKTEKRYVALDVQCVRVFVIMRCSTYIHVRMRNWQELHSKFIIS